VVDINSTLAYVKDTKLVPLKERKMITMGPLNKTAIELIDKLKGLGIKFKPRYFGGSSYCVGIEVEKPAEVFNLGVMLGREYRKVEFDLIRRKTIVVFRKAFVTA
jgi:hypothetical protein